MARYPTWPTTDQGNIVGARLANELYHKFTGGLSVLSMTDQKDAALAEILATTMDVLNVKSFGAKVDGTTDDSAAIQLAVDTAQTVVEATFGINVPMILFPQGTYAIASQIEKKSASWIGDGADNTILKWNGTAGATAIVQDGSSRGGNSATSIRGMSFYAGTTTPGTWLQIEKNDSGFGADKFFRLSELRFRGASSYLIDLDGYVNCHWDHLRFDEWDGFAIRITPVSGQNLSTFSLDGFTADHISGSTGEGFMLIDNSVIAVANMGTLRIANGRYENNAALTGRKAFIVVKSDLVDCVDLQLHNVTYQDVSDVTTGDSLIHHEGTAGTESFTLVNVLLEDLDAILGGTLITAWGAQGLPVVSYQYLAANRNGTVAIPKQSSGANAGLQLYTDDAGGKLGFRVFRKSEANPRIEMGSDGVVKIGGGSSAPDVVLRGRQTGWTAATGTADRATFVTSSVTLSELAERVKALIDDFITHGSIGT